MKYLVLGSAGQIGVPLCSYLKELGHKVLTFDIVDSEFEDLRISNNPKLNQYMEECDFVFFLAWDVGGSRYLAKYQDTYDFISNNVKIIANTFESISTHKKPFLFASSQMANMSYSTYGITKALGEKASAALNGITVKFWNVYGPEHNLEKSHVITDFILKAKTTGVIDMLTDGTEYRQLLHATDCSRCLYTLSKQYNELSRKQEYHITSFEWVSVLKVAEIIASNFPGTIIKPAVSKDNVQQDKRNEADPSILTYWKPEISLADGIKDIINSMISPIDKPFWEDKHSADDSWWLTGTTTGSLLSYHNISNTDTHGKTVLEIGVGLGTATPDLKNISNKLFCCDISETALARVKEFSDKQFLTTDLKFADPVDIAISHLVFQHCTDTEIKRIINDVNLTDNGFFSFQFASLKNNVVTNSIQHMIDSGSHFFRDLETVKKIVNQTNKEIYDISEPKWWGGKNQHEWYFIKVRNKK